MCARGDGVPGGYAEALTMIASGLDRLRAAAESGEVTEAEYGEVLLGLQAAQSKHAAARAAVLSRFDAADCHDGDGYQNSSSWLRDRARMTQPVARRQVKQMRTLRSRPRLAEAMAEGWLSESYADKIVTWTKPVPADMLDMVDQLVLSVLRAGGTLDDVAQVIAAALDSEYAQDQRDPDPGDPGDGFDERSLRLETTMDGAGVLTGNLTPEAAAALQAVLESLGKKRGKEDTRTQPQRDHDALQEACRRLLGSQMLPARAGTDTRAEVRIPFSELITMPGADRLTDAWLRAKVGEHGWLLGKDAETAACDALIVPVVTAAPQWPVIGEMVFLVLDAFREHGANVPGQHDAPLPLPPEAWQSLMYAMGRLAIRFVSGPGAIASLLRTGLLPAPFSTKSVPLDIGFSNHIPEAIRRAVTARAGGRCEWPGGCDRPAAACDVHHLKHKKDGGPTSAAGCGLFCDFHHDVCIHRRGWTVELQADGSVTAVSPDGQQVIRGHPPPARAA